MQAGRLKYRLVLMAPVESTDRFGSAKQIFEERATVRAERVKISGSRVEEAGEHFADYRTEWNIRDAHEVHEHWRVRQLGGLTYTVTNVIPNLDRGMLTLICERLNP